MEHSIYQFFLKQSKIQIYLRLSFQTLMHISGLLIDT